MELKLEPFYDTWSDYFMGFVGLLKMQTYLKCIWEVKKNSFAFLYTTLINWS